MPPPDDTLSDETLFERLRRGRDASSVSLSLDRTRLRASIVANLQRLFTSREQHAPSRPDYGMPDPGELLFSLPGGAELLRRRIKSAVEQFEPRLRDVKVLNVEAGDFGHTLRFALSGALVGAGAERWTFQATLRPDGRVHVQP